MTQPGLHTVDTQDQNGEFLGIVDRWSRQRRGREVQAEALDMVCQFFDRLRHQMTDRPHQQQAETKNLDRRENEDAQ